MNKLALGYYPGCSGLGSSMEYEASTRVVCSLLDITLQEIPDWSCCGSTPAHTVDHVLSSALAARNLAQAESVGIENIVTPCPSCLKNLKTAVRSMHDSLFKARIEALTLRPVLQEHSVKSVLQVFIEDVGLDAIKEKVTTPLTGLKVVPYYGCLMTRPEKDMQFDNPENPMALDSILEALGAEVLPFPLKVDCCGASFGIPKKEAVTRLTGRLLDMAADLGADVIVVACPLCQMNLDLRQGQINSANNTKHRIPIPYFTQLMGYAFGADKKSLGFNKLNIPLLPVLQAMKEWQVEQEKSKEEARKELAAKKELAAQKTNLAEKQGNTTAGEA